MRPFLLVIVTGVFALNLAAWAGFAWILRRAEIAPAWRWGWHGFVALQLAGVVMLLVARLVFRREPGTGADRPLHILTMLWNPLLSMPATALALGWTAVCALTGGTGASHPELVIAGVFLFPALALAGTAFSIFQLTRFTVTRRTVTIRDMPPELRGLRIAHLSDLHVGALTRGKTLRRITAAINGLDSDLIVLTGDLINMSLVALPEALDTLRGMRARHGLFAIEGNHDLMEDAAEFERRIRASGLNFLMNERAALTVKNRTVSLVGLRWGEGHGTAGEAAGLARLLAERTPGDFTIALAHHPDAFDATSAAGVPLTFAGHTHGGQLMLTSGFGFGPWFYRYWSGLYRAGDSAMIVSNGVGNWFPLRLGAPAEIVEVTLA